MDVMAKHFPGCCHPSFCSVEGNYCSQLCVIAVRLKITQQALDFSLQIFILRCKHKQACNRSRLRNNVPALHRGSLLYLVLTVPSLKCTCWVNLACVCPLYELSDISVHQILAKQKIHRLMKHYQDQSSRVLKSTQFVHHATLSLWMRRELMALE